MLGAAPTRMSRPWALALTVIVVGIGGGLVQVQSVAAARQPAHGGVSAAGPAKKARAQRRSADKIAPTKPASLTLVAHDGTSLAIRWSRSIDAGTGIALYSVSRNGSKVGSTTATHAVVSGLSCGRRYTLKVVAVDRVGNRSAPAALTASTTQCASPGGGTGGATPPPPAPAPAPPPPGGGADPPPGAGGGGDLLPPTAPLALSAVGSSQTSVSLSWPASSDNVGVTGYDVYRDGAQLATTSSTTYSVTGLSCNTSYSFAVDAFDAAGNRSAPTVQTAYDAGVPDG